VEEPGIWLGGVVANCAISVSHERGDGIAMASQDKATDYWPKTTRCLMVERTAHEGRNQSAEDSMALARHLRESREYLGLSQEAVAEHLGVPRASVSGMEGGKRKVSSMDLRDLSRLYRISVERLLGKQPDDDPVVGALYRNAHFLTQEDRQQVLRFAEFLRSAGSAPASDSG